jgi:hypothetical protein
MPIYWHDISIIRDAGARKKNKLTSNISRHKGLFEEFAFNSINDPLITSGAGGIIIKIW